MAVKKKAATKKKPAAKPKAARGYEQARAVKHLHGYAVKLDGNFVMTPKGEVMVAPSEALAKLIAKEWQGQKQKVLPATMPATVFAMSVIDRILPAREVIESEIVRYLTHESLCHWAAEPPALMALQEQEWRPWLEWAKKKYHLDLPVQFGLMPDSSPKVAEIVYPVLQEFDGWRLGALYIAAQMLGSGLVALAFAVGEIDADQALRLGFLHERWALKQWGEDEEARFRLKQIEAELIDVERCLKLLG
ncbi:MAG: ATP12 family protein [Dongiaceae bacterium]